MTNIKGNNLDKEKADNIIASFYSLIDYFDLKILNFLTPYDISHDPRITMTSTPNTLSISVPADFTYKLHVSSVVKNINAKIAKESTACADYFEDVKNKIIESLNILRTALSEDIDNNGEVIYNDL